MPAPTRTWTHSWNNAPSAQTTIEEQTREILRVGLKDILILAGWQVVGSTDGTNSSWDTAAAPTATDHWGTNGTLNWNSNGSAHSYFVLKSPSGYPSATKSVYLTIALSTGAGNQQDVNFSWASAIPTEDASPLINDPAQPANALTFTDKQLVPSPVSNVKYHAVYNTDGDAFLHVSEDGSARAAFGFASLETVNGDTGVLYPWWGFIGYADTGAGAATMANSLNSAHSTGFWQDDTLTITNQFGPCRLIQNVSDIQADFDSNGSDISTQFPDMPCHVASVFTNEVGMYGIFPDVSLAPNGSGVAQGTEVPTVTSSRTIVGHFWWPNDNNTPSF